MKKRLCFLASLVLAAIFALTGCGPATPPDEGGEKPDTTKPVITLSVEGSSEVRDYVKEDRAPSMRVTNVSQCKLSVSCTGPKGDAVEVNSTSYRFKVTDLGNYTFTYDAESPSGVKAQSVTYKIFYKDAGAVVAPSANAALYAKQQANWEFRFPDFSDILSVNHVFAGTTTKDYTGRISSAKYTPAGGAETTVADVNALHSYENGKVDLVYEIAAKSAPAQVISTQKFSIEIADYFSDPSTFTDNEDMKSYPTTFEKGTEAEFCAAGMDYYIKMQTNSAYGGIRWTNDNPILQSFNHTENSYLVIDGYNPLDKDAVLYLSVYDFGIYDGSFNGGEIDATWTDKCYQRGYNPIRGKSNFRIVIARDELAELNYIDLNFGMDWKNVWATDSVDKTDSKLSDTVYIQKLSIVTEGGGETVPVSQPFSAASSFQPIDCEPQNVTLTGSDKGLRFTHTSDEEVRYDLMTDVRFKKAIEAFVDPATRGKSVLAFDVTNLGGNQTSTADSYSDAYINRVMLFGLNKISSYTLRSTMVEGETITVHFDSAMVSQKQNQSEIEIFKFIIGAKGQCDVLLHNFRMINL